MECIMAKNYWQQKREYKDDGWIYLSHDFRIKHIDQHTFGADEIRTFMDEQEPKVKCPMCGRIKAVQKQEEHLFYCTYCQMQFDDRED